MSSKKKIIIICVAVVLILAIAAGVFFLLNSKKEYTVTFDTDGGSKIEAITVKKDKTLQLPKDPTKEGFKFLYWVDKDGKAVLNNFQVTSDLTLKAKWAEEDAEIFFVSFDTNGGSKIDDLEVIKGEKITLPKDPTKDGYTFKKWTYTDGTDFDTDKIIEEDITLKAVWEKKEEKKEEPKQETKQEQQQEQPKQEENNKPENVEATGITLNQSTVDLIIGNSGSLTATVTPDNAKDKTVTWSSSNSEVISIDGSGNLKANKIGEATITAKTSNGKTATAKVYSDVESITLTVSATHITSYGSGTSKSATLTVKTTPEVNAASICWNAPTTSTAYITPFGATANIYANAASSMTENVVSAYVGRKTSNKVKVYVEPELKLNFEYGLSSTVGTDPSRREYIVQNGVSARVKSNTTMASWSYAGGEHLLKKPSKQDSGFTFIANNEGDSNEAFTLKGLSKAGQRAEMRIKINVT